MYQVPWLGMLRTTWGDHDRCRQTYFSTYKDMYFTMDVSVVRRLL
jgi:acetyl-CoA synthetase